MFTNPQKETDFLMNALNSASIGVYHIYISKAKIFINDSFANILGYRSADSQPSFNRKLVRKFIPGMITTCYQQSDSAIR